MYFKCINVIQVILIIIEKLFKLLNNLNWVKIIKMQSFIQNSHLRKLWGPKCKSEILCCVLVYKCYTREFGKNRN